MKKVRMGVIYMDDMWVDNDIQVLLDDLRQFLPADVEMVSVRQYVPATDATVEQGLWLADSHDIEVAAQRLMRFDPQCIAYLCTTTSFIKGVGHDTEISNRIEEVTGVPAITTSTAAVKALNALGLSRISTVSPYMPEVDQRLTAFLQGNGFQVVAANPLGLAQDHSLNPSDAIREAAEDADRAEAEGIFISCTGQRTAGFIGELERKLGKPVVTSNQATFWCALHMLSVEPDASDLGRLYFAS
jgi:maleate isomerase